MNVWEQLKDMLVVVNDKIYDAVMYSHPVFGRAVSIFFKDIDTMTGFVKSPGKVQFKIKEKIAGTQIFQDSEMIGEILSYTDESTLLTQYKVSVKLC